MKSKSKSKARFLSNEEGFTLIEIILVIVVLGIMAVVAIPKYVDLKTEAQVAAADGVYGAAQGTTAINFAAGLVGAAGHAVIDSGTLLLAAFESAPVGWVADDTDANCDAHAGITGGTNGGCICLDDDASGTCNNLDTYIVAIDAAETATAKAVLETSW